MTPTKPLDDKDEFMNKTCATCKNHHIRYDTDPSPGNPLGILIASTVEFTECWTCIRANPRQDKDKWEPRDDRTT